MLIFKGSPRLHKVVVLNSKGGSGKTTLAFNLAGYLAATGRKAAIIDMDRQGSSMRWLQNRPSGLPTIVGLPAEVAYRDADGNQRIDVPGDIDYVVVDAPAGLSEDRLADYTCGAHAIFVPVMPSDLDVHAASRLISKLLLKAQVSRRNKRLCVVPSRVKERTIAYQQLRRFLDRLSITVVGMIRDSQNYVWAARNGMCIHEMPLSRVGKDMVQWGTISRWLEDRLATPLSGRDFLRPTEAAPTRGRARLQTAHLAPIAAAIGLLAIGLGVPRLLPPEAEPVQQTSFAEVTAPQLAYSETEALQRRWRLNGTVNWGDAGLLMVSDRTTDTAVVVRNDRDLDGWTVSEIGASYAVLSQGEDEVRLDVQYD